MGARKSKDWWKDHYDNWCASKLSMGVYSNNNGISKSTFYGWIKRFRELDSTTEINGNSKLKWATLNPVTTENTSLKSSDPSSLKVVIGKASIEVTSDFDSNLLSSVIKVLVDNA